VTLLGVLEAIWEAQGLRYSRAIEERLGAPPKGTTANPPGHMGRQGRFGSRGAANGSERMEARGQRQVGGARDVDRGPVRTPSQAREYSSAFAAGQVKRQLKPEGA
jgi:hypothetical protein